MDNTTLVIGKVSDRPKIVKKGYVTKFLFTVTSTEKGRPVHIEAEAPRDFIGQLKEGDNVEVIGRPFTRKVYINNRVTALPYIQAQTISSTV